MRPVLGLADEEVVVCGMALGLADPDAPESVGNGTCASDQFMAGEV